jgi:hypothetical protein
MRPPISVADLLRAFAALGPSTHEGKQAVARLLGFDWQMRTTEPAARKPEPAVDDRPAKPADPPPRPAPVQPPPAAAPARGRAAAFRFRLSGPQAAEPPDLPWRAAPALEQRPRGRPQESTPLFRPQWTRAILAASLSDRSNTGPPHIERAVELIARGEALRTLPRHPAMTLARAVQVLFDIGENMQPFGQDRRTLRRVLDRIVGREYLEVLHFAGSPRKTRREGAPGAWRDYLSSFKPQTGACVLVASDFGIAELPGLAESANPSEWRALAAELRRLGHRVVGFVPYPPARWPRSVGRAISLVQWDRATTVGRVRFSRTDGRST